jgi:hypothetical protein
MMAWFFSMRSEEKLLLALSVAALASVYLMVANGWLWGNPT